MSPTLDDARAKALDAIFHGPAKTANPELVLLDYRNPATFSSLWLHGLETGKVKIGGQQIDLTDFSKQFLLIGNDPPDGVFDTKIPALSGINFRSHFTSKSWLAAWKVKFAELRVSIAVIDGSDGMPQGAARALQAILGSSDITGNSLVPGATVLNAPSLANICEWLKDSKADEWILAEDAPHLRDLLKSTIWNDLASDREKHHALSNVLGALLLSSQVGRGAAHSGDPRAQDYLLALTRACGIDADLHQIQLKEHGGFQRWVTPEQQRNIGAAVLIDDMSQIWEYFLRGATGFAGDRLFGNTGRTYRECFECFGPGGFRKEIGALPQRLIAFLESGRERLSATDLLGTPSKIDDHFTLFLDLRLFGKSDGEISEWFYSDLVELGRKLLTDATRPRPWLDTQSLSELGEDLKGTGKHLKETLLPRLISLLDPTLPIVIFSSSHRTELVESFRDYGNVITTFRKPILGGLTQDWAETVTELHGDFTVAIERAIKILKTRWTFQSFSSKASGHELAVLPASENGFLVEIFLDESEESTQKRPPRAVCAGGIIVVRAVDSKGTPLVSDNEIFDSLAASNCLWGWSQETPQAFLRPQNSPLKRGFLKKGADLNFIGAGSGGSLLGEMISATSVALGQHGVLLPFAAIANRELPCPEWMQSPAKNNPWSVERILDATLRRLIQHVLESLIFRSSLLRSALHHPNTRVAIDLGIRDYPCEPNLSLSDAFGFEIIRGWRPSFHSEDGYQITAETIARTGIPWPFRSRIVRARAVALRDFGNYGNCPAGLLPNQLHYFADTIAHVALDDLEVARRCSKDVREFFDSGWVADFRTDREEGSRLEIGRAWDQGDRITAIAWAAEQTHTTPANGLGIDLFHEIAAGTARLSGQELNQIFSAIR